MTGYHSQPQFAQDPDELFDVLDSTGHPTGKHKRREDVHRDGDWHRALHVWLVDSQPQAPSIFFQRRGQNKDTWPLKLDATVGGHFRASEHLDDVLREVEEEIGIVARREELIHIGVRRASDNGEADGIDNEFQEVYLWPGRWILDALQPNPFELEALVELPSQGVIELFSGRVDVISCRSRITHGNQLITQRVTLQDFIPTMDQYPLRIAQVLERFLTGTSDLQF